MTQPAKTTAVDDARKLERIFIVNHVAGPESGVLARGLLFRSIHDSKEQAEKYVVLACHNGTQRIDEYVSEAQLSEQRTTIERLERERLDLIHALRSHSKNLLDHSEALNAANECIRQLEQDRLRLQEEKDTLVRIYQKDEVWYWQGDGEDHLESLTCPIIITAAKMRQLEQDKLKLEGELRQEREAKDMHDRHSVSLMEQRKELKAEVAQLQATISQQATEIERLKEFEFMYKDLSK